MEGERERLHLLDHARTEHDRRFLLHHNSRTRGKVGQETQVWGGKHESKYGAGRGEGPQESRVGIAGEVTRWVVAGMVEDLYREVRGYMALQ